MNALVKRTSKSLPRRRIAVAFCVGMASATVPAAASDFTAEKVIKEMAAKERFSFIAGVVEGLAVARYMKDGKQDAGMSCIYGWFYDDKGTYEVILSAFDRYATYPPGSIIDTLVKQQCGE